LEDCQSANAHPDIALDCAKAILVIIDAYSQVKDDIVNARGEVLERFVHSDDRIAEVAKLVAVWIHGIGTPLKTCPASIVHNMHDSA
jgi:hypothetical protein